MIAIRTEGLGKDYRIQQPETAGRLKWSTKCALNSVDCEISAGEVFGIIGRNGSGKSTLLKILAKIVAPTRGRAIVHGRVSALLEVGTGMHPEMTGRENVFLNGALLGMSRSEIRVKFDEIVAFAAIDEYIDTPIKRYSSGMRLRLAFAVAAFLSADVMIVDEVLAVGDAEFQSRCIGTMRESIHSGRTVLFVSHSMPSIEGLCSRVAWLEAGELIQVGPAGDVVQAYLGASLSSGRNGSEICLSSGTGSDGRLLVSRVGLAGIDGKPVQQGCDIQIEIDLSVRVAVRSAKLLFKIATIEGYPVCGMSSADYGTEWTFEPGQYRVTARLQDPRLLPRAHTLSVYIYTHWDSEVLDRCENVLVFDVVERDVLGFGRPLRMDRGVTWVDSTFEMAVLGVGEQSSVGEPATSAIRRPDES